MFWWSFAVDAAESISQGSILGYRSLEEDYGVVYEPLGRDARLARKGAHERNNGRWMSRRM
jgi:hypothetical protein